MKSPQKYGLQVLKQAARRVHERPAAATAATAGTELGADASAKPAWAGGSVVRYRGGLVLCQLARPTDHKGDRKSIGAGRAVGRPRSDPSLEASDQPQRASQR